MSVVLVVGPVIVEPVRASAITKDLPHVALVCFENRTFLQFALPGV